MLDLVGMLVGPITGLLEKVVPDLDERKRLAHEIATMAQKQSHEVVIAQIKVNEQAAKHPSRFVSGARPAALWVSVTGFAYNVIVYPILNIWADMPPLEDAALMTVMMGLLGLGTMRSFDRKNGVARVN